KYLKCLKLAANANKPLRPESLNHLNMQRKKLVLRDRHGVSEDNEKIESKRGTSAFFLQIKN
ncbi:MAG: hypothetical protein KJ717_00815, partial [Proteobacteria bacterium]|nr:hypothetical protein [Pseudomonadota bacterium]